MNAAFPAFLAALDLPWLDGNYRFQDPEWAVAALVIVLVLLLKGRRKVPVLIVPFASAWHRPSLRSFSRWPVFLACLGLLLLIVALARPQRIDDKREVRAQGYDLVLAIDLSTSMLAEDYERDGTRINRLAAIQPVIQAFVKDRPSDRIGIVIFAGRAYTLAPLTFDHDWLLRQLERLKVGAIEDGTAIGDGLGIALSRLEQAKREVSGKRMGAFIILLTDGVNNRGSLDPVQAGEIAKNRRIPIYTIGAGKEGFVPYPVGKRADGSIMYQPQFSRLDETLLRNLAGDTGGRFFRADDMDTIKEAFSTIDASQKIEFQARSHLLTTELFPWFAAPGLVLLLLGALAAPKANTQR